MIDKKSVSTKEALKALKNGKKVKSGELVFEAIGLDKSMIVDQDGFVYTEYLKLYGDKCRFNLVI